MTAITMPVKTLEDALNYLAPKHCGACGEPLDPPGTPCGECGTLPRITRPELAEELLAEPGSIARVERERLDAEAAAEVKRLRAAAMERLAEAEHLFRDADAVDYRAVLRRRRDAAEGALQAAAGVREQLAAELEQAETDEEAARAPLAEAADCHKKAEEAEENARRMRRGATAETEALVRLDAAAKVLARHQDEARAAARARQVAEAAFGIACQNVTACEADRDAAAAALTRCAPVPVSTETVRAAATPLMRIAAGYDIGGQALTVEERAMAGVYGQSAAALAFADYHGALVSMERSKRAEEDRTANPPHLRQVGDGMLSASWPIPPKPSGGPSGGVVTPAPNLAPLGPFGRPAGGVIPGLG